MFGSNGQYSSDIFWRDANPSGILPQFQSEKEVLEKEVPISPSPIESSQMGQLPIITTMTPGEGGGGGGAPSPDVANQAIQVLSGIETPRFLELGFTQAQIDDIQNLLNKISSGEDIGILDIAKGYTYYQQYEAALDRERASKIKITPPTSPPPPPIIRGAGAGIPTGVLVVGGLAILGISLALALRK